MNEIQKPTEINSEKKGITEINVFLWMTHKVEKKYVKKQTEWPKFTGNMGIEEQIPLARK